MGRMGESGGGRGPGGAGGGEGPAEGPGPAGAAAAPAPRASIWSPTFGALLLMNLLMGLGQSTAGTLLPLYAHDLGASTSVVGFIAGAFAVTALLVRPFVGPAFDSFSKKRMLMGAIALLALCGFCYSAARSVPAILLVRFMHGLAMGCSGPLGLALVSETLPQSRLSGGVSVYTVSQAAAQAVGPALGISLSRSVGYGPTFVLMGVSFAFALAVLGVFVREPDDGPRPPYRLRLSRAFAREALGPALILMLLSSAFACTSSFIPIYGGLLGVNQIGLYFTVYAVCLVVTRPLLGGLSDRVGTTRVLVPAMACFALSFVLLSRAGTLGGFLAAAVVSAFGFGVCTPLVQAVVFRCVPHEKRGSASNTSYMGLDLGNLVGPYTAGLVVEALAPGMGEAAAYSRMWLVMIVPIAAGLAAFLVLRPRLARYAAAAEAERRPQG